MLITMQKARLIMSNTLILSMVNETIRGLSEQVRTAPDEKYVQAFENGWRKAVIEHALWNLENVRRELLK